MSWILFYGTLLEGDRRPYHDLPNISGMIQVLGQVSVPGQLWDINGTYPGFVPGEGLVRAELCRIDVKEEDLWRLLDPYEDCGPGTAGEYRREKLPVRLPCGESVEAWVYIYNWPLHRARRIEHGDWLRYIKRHTGIV